MPPGLGSEIQISKVVLKNQNQFKNPHVHKVKSYLLRAFRGLGSGFFEISKEFSIKMTQKTGIEILVIRSLLLFVVTCTVFLDFMMLEMETHQFYGRLLNNMSLFLFTAVHTCIHKKFHLRGKIGTIF